MSMVQFFLTEILNKNFTTEMANFGFFELIKTYSDTNLFIDKKITAEEASYTSQENSRKVKSLKICINQILFA